jgi:hypothetical protein
MNCLKEKKETKSEKDLNDWYEKRDKYELLDKLSGPSY